MGSNRIGVSKNYNFLTSEPGFQHRNSGYKEFFTGKFSMMKYLKYLFYALVPLATLVVSCDSSDQSVDASISRKMASVQQFNEDGTLVDEIEFVYDDDLLIQTNYTNYRADDASNTVEDFIYEDDRLIHVKMNEELSTHAFCGSGNTVDLIYVNDKISKFIWSIDGVQLASNATVELQRKDNQEIVGYLTNEGTGFDGHDAIISLDDRANIVDIVNAEHGKRDAGGVGKRGMNTYDQKNNPFVFFSEEVKTYWSFGFSCTTIGEMLFSIGTNNRISCDPDLNQEVPYWDEYWTMAYAYDNADYPVGMSLKQIVTEGDDTLGISTLHYDYTYLSE